jgi:release factor glutamine methyltransferase
VVPAGGGRSGAVSEQTAARRVETYRHLLPADRVPPGPGVFFDPVDTEAGIWATVDLVSSGCTVLDLGSGSGAAARALVQAGAGRVHGVDVSAASVVWATESTARQGGAGSRATFVVADYTAASAAELVAECPFDGAPDIVTSNPPYVPLAPRPQGRVSIDGGPDGLRLARVVIRHAHDMGADLALTLGSYSCPQTAAELLAAAGYEIVAVTLSALRLGRHTLENATRVLELEAEGAGPLLRTDDGVVHYVVMALSCRRAAAKHPAAGDLLALMRVACLSRSVELERLDSLPDGWSVPVRILVLPDEPRRHHA